MTIQGGQDVAELTSTADRKRVTGVRVIDRVGGTEQQLTAGLVVDAMGRGAHTPAFLESLGYGRPVEDHIVDAHDLCQPAAADPVGHSEGDAVAHKPRAGPAGMVLVQVLGSDKHPLVRKVHMI